ncbi:AAA family ATPase [Paraburkholderia nemoris]|uniref:AAA family ATPase n=1 Tax=Paraburkholderia nemoris TaxID=2793076 RepID=UPI0038BD2552
MDIQKLEGENFLKLGKFEVELDKRGLLLVQGVNLAEPSAKSNGSGKSSLLDAISWCLFGVTARGVTGDSVVNNKIKKDCFVAVVLVDGDYEYRVVRYRKHSTLKNALMVTQRNLKTGIGTDISKGTDKETQAVVESIVGCSADVFNASVYAGQEKMPDLPGMTDKQLKVLIEEAAGVEVLTEAYRIARQKALVAQTERDRLASGVVNGRDNLTSARNNLASAQTEEAAFEAGRKDRAKDHLRGVIPLTNQIAEKRAFLEKLDVTGTQARVEELGRELAAHNEQATKLSALENELRSMERTQTVAQSAVQHGKDDLTRRQQAIDNIAARVGTPCGECGKAYCEHDLASAKQAQEEGLRAAKEALLPKARELKEMGPKIEAKKGEIAKFKATMTDVSAAVAGQKSLNAILAQEASAEREIATLNGQIETIKAQAQAKLKEPNPWGKVREEREAAVKHIEVTLAELERNLEVADKQLQIANDAVKVFGPAGVRAHILDTVTPFLNARTSEYLGMLSDGNIQAVWSTLTRNAKGETKEKFNIEVTYEDGAEGFGGLSGGEKRKVRLATATALQDLVATRATKPINIFLADEIDHALDDAGLERLMDMLNKKARERGTVVVVSHNNLADWIDTVITVTREGKTSRVEGATHHVS